jgi:hypothetical protein
MLTREDALEISAVLDEMDCPHEVRLRKSEVVMGGFEGRRIPLEISRGYDVSVSRVPDVRMLVASIPERYDISYLGADGWKFSPEEFDNA